MTNISTILKQRLLGAAIAATALIIPTVASAQAMPSYAAGGGDQQIHGTVAAINGTWNITVADANGYDDSVALHTGTIINPTGLTLEPGMNVTIDGYADGPNFDALEIDTPYQYQGPAPVAVYYGPGAWYPGYADGWGPSFSLVFDIGSNRVEQRSFNVGGDVRRPIAPPSGWQNQPHGYIGNTTANTQRRYAQQAQQYRTVSFAAPQQQTRSFAAPQPQVRNFAAPQQQARSFTAPAAHAAPRGNDGGGRRR